MIVNMNIRLVEKHTRDEKKIEFQMPNMLLGITFILSLIHNIRNLIYDGMSRILLMRAEPPREFHVSIISLIRSIGKHFFLRTY